jgi:hypothetical protein
VARSKGHSTVQSSSWATSRRQQAKRRRNDARYRSRDSATFTLPLQLNNWSMSIPNPKRSKGRSQIGVYPPIFRYEIERKDLTMDDTAAVIERRGTRTWSIRRRDGDG